MVVPHSWTGPDRPMYIHLAGTGDHVRVCVCVINHLPETRIPQ